MTSALTYVEIDVDYCSLVYGSAPCVATLTGETPTGTIKCFNTLKTCQDRANFDNAPVTLRFTLEGVDYAPADIEAIPNLQGVSFRPGRISLGRNLGQRASVTIPFQDHRHGDAGNGFDKYLTERPYDPFTQGTFWGKFRARQPFLRGRPLRVIQGFLGQTLGEMDTRHYVIDSFDGPTPDGTYTIIAKDVLKLADGDRAQAPLLSNGFLASDITSGATSATLSPSGIGDAEYPASGLVAIGGKEICTFTRSGNVLTLTRAQKNTAAKAHSDLDRVQLCLDYDAQDPGDIIADLLENYAGVNSSFIPIATWNVETQSFLARLYTATITEPTSVNKLVSEIIEQAGLAVWVDDLSQLVRLQVLRGITTDAASINEGNTLEDSLKSKEQPETRASRVWVYYGQINPLEGQEDPDNYRSSVAVIDTDAEADYGSPAIRKIFSRWIPAGGRPIASKPAEILLSRFRNPPRRFNLSLHRTGPVIPALGQGYQLEATSIQDATGAPATAPIQITRINPLTAKFDVEAEEMLYIAPAGLGDRIVVIEVGTNNVNLRDFHDQLYPTAESGDKVVCIIQSGATVGSTSTSVAALDIGSWPAGVEIIVQCLGRIQGAGGKGGNGATYFTEGSQSHASAAGVGGVALLTAVAIKLDASTGEAWGGGGGGGGGGAELISTIGGSGGGGGAGTNPGNGGSAGQGNDGHHGANGSPGSADAGGPGGPGQSYGGTGGPGGAGAGPGLSGSNGSNSALPPDGAQASSGAAPGAAIDGVSLVTLGEYDGTDFTPGETMTEDIRGPEIN